MPRTETERVPSGWVYRVTLPDGAVTGGWAPTEADAERQAAELIEREVPA